MILLLRLFLFGVCLSFHTPVCVQAAEFRHFQGTLGAGATKKYEVEIFLKKEALELSGFYFYSSKKIPISLKGKELIEGKTFHLD